VNLVDFEEYEPVTNLLALNAYNMKALLEFELNARTLPWWNLRLE